MKLGAFTWKNYRRIPDGEITVGRHLILIGPNDSGKSSILRGIHLCLGMAHPRLATALGPRDFTIGDEPLALTAELHDLTREESQAFPDEIDLGPPRVLRIRVEAELDEGNQETLSVRRYFPDAGHTRSPSRTQLEVVNLAFVSAARSLSYELGPAAGGAVRSALANVDLSADRDQLVSLLAEFESAITSAQGVEALRQSLSRALTTALPQEISEEDIALKATALSDGNLLAGLSLHLRTDHDHAPIGEQSDGVRALALLAILSMSHDAASIVLIDEPEIHLHSSAQRAIGAALYDSHNQQLIATHSSAITSQFGPNTIVAFSPSREARQLPVGHRAASGEIMTRHWSHRLIDPLTSRAILMVEGPADRIMCRAIAHHHGIHLDRYGTAVFELDGAGFFGMAWNLFGSPGFDLPVFGLVDADHEADWAAELGVPTTQLATSGVHVCRPDLEGVYVGKLGCDRIVNLLLGRRVCSEHSLLAGCGASQLGTITEARLAQYCRHSKRKVRSALAVSEGMTPAEALLFTEIYKVVAAASGT